MGNRTTNVDFNSCPICGKKPYLKILGINYGYVYCDGTFFKRHSLVQFNSDYCQPTELLKTLSNKWNNQT